MNAVGRWLGALLLSLTLPGFLVPGGLDFSVCTCAAMDARGPASAQSCCERVCCDAQPQPGPVFSQAHKSCCSACVSIQTPQREAATSAPSGQSPLAALPAPAKAFAAGFFEAMAIASTPRPCASAAPPLCAASLPLRI